MRGEVVCHDLECRAHGRYLRRIRRLQLAVVRERAQNAESRRRLGISWSAYLDLLIDSRLEDGTPLLSVVLEHHPELRDRLDAALRGTT
jgi:hypothetical protein